MRYIGQPVSFQNTSEGWQVTWDDAAGSRTESGGQLESVSFTVLVPGKAETSVHEAQKFALQRALKLLQEVLDAAP